MLIFFVICVSRLSSLYCFVCSLQPCCHLLGKGWPLDSLVCEVLHPYLLPCIVVTFQHVALIVSISNLFIPLNFNKQDSELQCLFRVKEDLS